MFVAFCFLIVAVDIASMVLAEDVWVVDYWRAPKWRRVVDADGVPIQFATEAEAKKCAAGLPYGRPTCYRVPWPFVLGEWRG